MSACFLALEPPQGVKMGCRCSGEAAKSRLQGRLRNHGCCQNLSGVRDALRKEIREQEVVGGQERMKG